MQMTNEFSFLRDLLSSPKVKNDLHLEEDLTRYFRAPSSIKTESGQSRRPEEDGTTSSDDDGDEEDIPNKDAVHVLDMTGGWASPYGLALGGPQKDSFVHLTCALFSPRTWLKNNKQWRNLKSEIRRSRLFKCHLCSLKGATVGCYQSNCRQILHVPCALKLGWKPSLAQKDYYCAAHRKDTNVTQHSDVDISRGYESLPVTMDLCPCQLCVPSIESNNTGYSNSYDPNTSTNENSSHKMMAAGIYPGITKVFSPFSTLASSCHAKFLYITRNVDHEDVNSWPSKVNAIAYYCDSCTQDNSNHLCGGVGAGDVSRCACAFQVS